MLVRAETDDGVIGFGGAAPANNEGGESDDSCLAALEGPLREFALGVEVPADPSPLADHRITSYNVCYTKLLRMKPLGKNSSDEEM